MFEFSDTGPVSGRVQYLGYRSFDALCQDCTQAPTGVGSPAPEQKSKQRMMPETGTTAQALGVDIGGRSVTIEGVMFFSENHRQACLPKGMIK